MIGAVLRMIGGELGIFRGGVKGRGTIRPPADRHLSLYLRDTVFRLSATGRCRKIKTDRVPRVAAPPPPPDPPPSV